MNHTNITGIILSGGKSSRMGTDKGLILYKDRALIEYPLQYLKPYCNEVMISANSEGYKYLGYPVIADTIKNIGPIGGINSCFEKANNEKVFITACDIPEIDEKIIQSMIDKSLHTDVVFLNLSSGKIQSLPLILNKKIYPIIQSQIQKKQYALHNLISECIKTVGIRSQKVLIEEEPGNINTLNDLNHD